MDITYIPVARSFVYLVAVVGWFSRRVLAWRLLIPLEAAFYVEAVEEALARYVDKLATTDVRGPGRRSAGNALDAGAEHRHEQPPHNAACRRRPCPCQQAPPSLQ